MFKYAAFAPNRVNSLVMVCRGDSTVSTTGANGDVRCNVSVMVVSGV